MGDRGVDTVTKCTIPKVNAITWGELLTYNDWSGTLNTTLGWLFSYLELHDVFIATAAAATAASNDVPTPFLSLWTHNFTSQITLARKNNQHSTSANILLSSSFYYDIFKGISGCVMVINLD